MAVVKTIALCGQSNAAGGGSDLSNELADLPVGLSGVHNSIKIYSQGLGTSLDSSNNDNQHPFENGKFGPEYKMMVEYQSYHNETVALLKHAKGDTALYDITSEINWSGTQPGSLRDWMKSSFSYDIHKASQVGRTLDVRAFVWVQGEKDATNATYAAAYETNLTNFIADMRSFFGKPTLPFVIVRLNSNVANPPHTQFATIQTAQDNVAAADANVYVYDPDALAMQSDDTHYTGTGYINMGQGIFDILKDF